MRGEDAGFRSGRRGRGSFEEARRSARPPQNFRLPPKPRPSDAGPALLKAPWGPTGVGPALRSWSASRSCAPGRGSVRERRPGATALVPGPAGPASGSRTWWRPWLSPQRARGGLAASGSGAASAPLGRRRLARWPGRGLPFLPQARARGRTTVPSTKPCATMGSRYRRQEEEEEHGARDRAESDHPASDQPRAASRANRRPVLGRRARRRPGPDGEGRRGPARRAATTVLCGMSGADARLPRPE